MNLQQRIQQKSDISEHLQTLHDLAASFFGCVVVEFGTRSGNSTCAFLEAGAVVLSYDIGHVSFEPENADQAARWTLYKADTGKLADVPPCDILFIDSLHTGAHVRAELKHGNAAGKYIVFHDTVLFGSYGELGQSGITSAIYEFLAENPHWRVKAHYENNNGLLILERT